MKKLLITISLLASAGSFALGQTNPPKTYRPKYHFTAPKNWINDPNGMVYYAGEYHLFYQHNPFDNVWGHMSWGHAVSKDLLHWQHLPLAIPEFMHPDGKTSTAIFSGSAIIDKGNRSGLCPAGTNDCMVAIYTSNVTQGEKHLDQHQSLAFSADKGRTWTQYAKNPVIDLETKEFRDPNVFWYAPQKKWVMATVKATEHRAAFYESRNLKDWTLLSYFGPAADTSRVWECPSLMPVPIQNEPGKTKWVLFISAGHPQKGYLGMQYFVGDFDGTTFKPDNNYPVSTALTEASQDAGTIVDWGKDYYAAIPFNDRPAGKVNPIMMGWINDWEYANKIPTSPFNGAMSVPREVTLKRTSTGLELVQQPMSLRALRGKPTTATNLTVNGSRPLDFTGESYELDVEFAVGSAQKVGIQLLKSEGEASLLTYDVATKTLSFDRTKSGNVGFSDRFPSVESMPVELENGSLKLHVLVDVSVVEIFAADGRRVLTDAVFPTKRQGRVELFSEGGEARVKSLTIWPIK